MRTLDVLISKFITSNDLQSKKQLTAQFVRWRNNYKPLAVLLSEQKQLSSLKYLAIKDNDLSELALLLITKKYENKPLTSTDVENALSVIEDARHIDSELIVIIASRVEKILDSMR
jgi:hypothetical protein